MKFTANTKTLKAACAAAKRAVSGKTSLPALDCLLLRCDSGKLEVAGYDLELCIKTSIEVIEHGPGACLLNAALLCNILSKVTAETVTVEDGSLNKAKITAGKSVYKLNTMPADDFPEPPSINGGAPIPLPLGTLKDMVRQTIYAVAINPDTKPIHTGVKFELRPGELCLAAIDGFRLATRREAIDYDGEELGFVVPPKALNELRSMGADDEMVSVAVGRRHIVFDIGNYHMVSRLLDGEFMNYRAAIPAEWKQELMIDRSAMLAEIKRVSLIITEKIKPPTRVVFSPADDEAIISCTTGAGEAHERVSVEGCTQEIEIGFNHRFLVDALNACTDDTVQLRTRSEVQPVIFVPLQEDGYMHMVLPVRLRAGE